MIESYRPPLSLKLWLLKYTVRCMKAIFKIYFNLSILYMKNDFYLYSIGNVNIMADLLDFFFE